MRTPAYNLNTAVYKMLVEYMYIKYLLNICNMYKKFLYGYRVELLPGTSENSKTWDELSV